MPVTAARTNENSRNDATYVAESGKRPTRQTITEPSSQITTIGATTFPHCTLRSDTVSGARNRIRLTPRFDGFHRWRPRKRRTYFDAIEMNAQSAYGHRNGDRSRMPTLMPVMYALAAYGHLPYVMRPSTISLANAVRIASPVRSHPSRMPNDRCAVMRMLVMSSGGRKRLSSRSHCFPFGMGPAAATPVSSVTRFPHDVHLVWR